MWGRGLLLCFLVITGSLSHPPHDAPAVAQTQANLIADAAQPLEGRHDGLAGRPAFCHAIGACLYLPEAAAVLPTVTGTSGAWPLDAAIADTARPLDGLYRPPRFPAHA